MRCHYEVLGLERGCTDDDIRKAYRKVALIWHPDKNQHRLEEAEEKFKEISNAYEVLSDPHERAWYDSHREAILRSGERHQTGSGADFAGGHKPESEPDLFHFFSSTAYSGYNDGPKGFYTVYNNIFSKLAEQEAEAGNEQPLPPFGSSGAESRSVTAFYSQWLSFSTCKPFAWADEYNPAGAPNRQIRRRMEEENRKSRRAARKEYIDTVRELVLFVRKRDKRLIAIQQAEAQKRAEREAAEAKRREQQRAERQRLAATYEDADWIRASEELGDGEAADGEGSGAESESEEEEVEEFYCIACEKSFKSAKQMENHERSKRHRQKMAQLREALEQDEEAIAELGILNGGAEERRAAAEDDAPRGDGGRRARAQQPSRKDARGGPSPSGPENGTDPPRDAGDRRPKVGEKTGPDADGGLVDDAASRGSASSDGGAEEEDEEEDEDAILARMIGSQAGRGVAAGESSDGGAEEEEESEEDDEDAILARMVGAKKEGTGRDSGVRSHENGDREHEEEQGGNSPGAGEDVPRSQCDVSGGDGVTEVSTASLEAEDAALASLLERCCKPSRGWSPQVGADSHAPLSGAGLGTAAAGSSSSSKRMQKGARKSGKKAPSVGQQKSGCCCTVCGREFGSRNKLFRHISETGHAALKN